MSNVPRWLLGVLGVSVTLNLIGLGWLIGRGTTHGDAPASALHGFEIHVDEESAIHPGDVTRVIRTLRVPPIAPLEAVSPDAPHVPQPVVAAEVPPDVSRGLKWIVATLPPGRRETIGLELDARAGPLLEETEKVFVIREEIREELARSEFEKQRLEAALARLREQIVAIQAGSHSILADVAEELSEQEREALAGRLAASMSERALGVHAAAIAEEAERLAAQIELEDGAVQVYTSGFVHEHEQPEETDPPDE